jgi:hypothetical protein
MIISAFPGVGKSHFYNTYKDEFKIHDSDSSLFSWIVKDGQKIRNPDFPKNYIEHLESLDPKDIIIVFPAGIIRALDIVKTKDEADGW